MINVYENKNCCICNACTQVCPTNCISLKSDKEGFAFPVVDIDNCIDCDRCDEVCPMLTHNESRTCIETVAAINKNDEIRLKSSSGGLFYILAKKTIEDGGVVFGARFNDEWYVEHSYTESLNGIKQFLGSKYILSNINDSFIDVRKFLSIGRKVLFSGAPCQVLGLHNFLGEEFDNLITVDFICHGVASPKILNLLLKQSVYKKIGKSDLKYVKGLSFRDKTNGWHDFGLVAKNNNGTDEVLLSKEDTKSFWEGFGANIFLMPSCHFCPAKNLSSKSDITLADFWGVEEILPDFDDNKGCSLLLVNTERAKSILENVSDQYEGKTVDKTKALQKQKGLKHSLPASKYRSDFWKSDIDNNIIENIHYYSNKKTVSKKLNLMIRTFLRTVGVRKLYYLLKRT